MLTMIDNNIQEPTITITNCIHVDFMIKYQCEQLLSISMQMIVNNSEQVSMSIILRN